MSKKMNLSDVLSLPIELVTRRSAIFGVSGSGKSNTAMRIIEMLLEHGEQVVMIDPKGEGWGLQTSADGKKAAFDIIVFGQPRGDIPELREEHAEQIADFVVDSGRSVVLSLLGFDSDQAERRFVTRFFHRLYRIKSQQATKTRTLVVLEEAHLFVPEQASGASGEMVGAIKRIARQGRSAGIGLMVVDQRPQEVAKSIISQSELLICHQLVHKLDRDALRDWVRAYDRDGQGEAFLDSLAELRPGEAWAWSPAWLHLFVRTQIDRRKTYDSGKTPDGSAQVDSPKAKAVVDLDKLRSHLAKVVDQAKQNDPKILKTELAAAKAALLKLQNAAPAPVKVESKTVEKYVLKDGQIDRIIKTIEKMDALVIKATQFQTECREMANSVVTAIATTKQPVPPAARVAPAAGREPAFRSRTAEAVVINPRFDAPASGNGEKLPEGERIVLTAIAQYPDGADRDQLTVLTGYKRSTRDAYIQRLFSRGYIMVGFNGSKVKASPEGVHALGSHFKPLPTGVELQSYWLNKLPDGERKVLEVLIRRYPAFVDRETITQATDYKRSTRDAYIQRLKTRKLVESTSAGVSASNILFE